MMNGWWLLWLVFLLLFLIPSIGYGWGYQRWGPPYPRYIQRRRMTMARLNPIAEPFDHLAWGRGGDYVWIMIVVLIISIGAAFILGNLVTKDGVRWTINDCGMRQLGAAGLIGEDFETGIVNSLASCFLRASWHTPSNRLEHRPELGQRTFDPRE